MRRGRPLLPIPTKACISCGRVLVRKRYRASGRLERRSCFLLRKYCDVLCQRRRGRK